MILFVAAWAVWRSCKRKGSVLFGITFLLYIACMPYTSGILLHTLENRYSPQPNVGNCDAIVVIGYGAVDDRIDVDGELGDLTSITSARISAAARLQHIIGKPIIVSGGKVFDTSGCESEIGARQLIHLGVAPSNVICENKSRTTRENAEYTQKILNQYNFKNPILIASAFHLPRAVLEFKKVGVNVIPYPVDWHTRSILEDNIMAFIPTYDGLWGTGTASREWIGIAAAQLR